MDYEKAYKILFNAITNSVNKMVDDIIDKTDGKGDVIIPEDTFEVLSILRNAQQTTENMYIDCGE